jgi:hypothetical protein
MHVFGFMLMFCVGCVQMSGKHKDHRAFYRFFDLSASPTHLRRRFRQLALEFHPDKVQGGPAEKEAAKRKFLLLSTAFHKLLARSRDDDPEEESRERDLRAARDARERKLRDDAQKRDAERYEKERLFEQQRRMQEEQRRREDLRRMLQVKQFEISILLERGFVFVASVLTVMGFLVAYYCFSLRDEVVLISEARKTIIEQQKAERREIATKIDGCDLLYISPNQERRDDGEAFRKRRESSFSSEDVIDRGSVVRNSEMRAHFVEAWSENDALVLEVPQRVREMSLPLRLIEEDVDNGVVVVKKRRRSERNKRTKRQRESTYEEDEKDVVNSAKLRRLKKRSSKK